MTTRYSNETDNQTSDDFDIVEAMVLGAGEVTVAIGENILNPHKAQTPNISAFSQRMMDIYEPKTAKAATPEAPKAPAPVFK